MFRQVDLTGRRSAVTPERRLCVHAEIGKLEFGVAVSLKIN